MPDWVELDTEDSGAEGMLELERDVSDEESRLSIQFVSFRLFYDWTGQIKSKSGNEWFKVLMVE